MFFDSKLGTLFTFSYKPYSLHALLESNKSWDLADKQTPYSSLTPDATLLGQREKESQKCSGQFQMQKLHWQLNKRRASEQTDLEIRD